MTAGSNRLGEMLVKSNLITEDQLKKALAQLQSTGPVNLHGSVSFESGVGLGEPVRSWWNVA